MPQRGRREPQIQELSLWRKRARKRTIAQADHKAAISPKSAARQIVALEVAGSSSAGFPGK